MVTFLTFFRLIRRTKYNSTTKEIKSSKPKFYYHNIWELQAPISSVQTSQEASVAEERSRETQTLQQDQTDKIKPKDRNRNSEALN